MTDSDTEYREEVLALTQKHTPTPAQLRDLSDDLEELADKWDEAGEVLT